MMVTCAMLTSTMKQCQSLTATPKASNCTSHEFSTLSGGLEMRSAFLAERITTTGKDWENRQLNSVVANELLDKKIHDEGQYTGDGRVS